MNLILILSIFIGLIIIGVVLYFMLKKSTNIITTSANKKESTDIITISPNQKGFLQILPTSPDTSSNYQFLRPTTTNSGFTISMWVKFPGVRDFKDANNSNKIGQAECLVEIFKNNAWKEKGTNYGGYFNIVRRGNNYGTNLNNTISAGFIAKEINGPAITDTNWHHIAVSVKLVIPFKQNNSKYEIALFVDGMKIPVDGTKTSKVYDITDKDQIFMGPEAQFNVGKYTRGMSECTECGYANMSFTKPLLHKYVLTNNEITNIVANKPS